MSDDDDGLVWDDDDTIESVPLIKTEDNIIKQEIKQEIISSNNTTTTPTTTNIPTAGAVVSKDGTTDDPEKGSLIEAQHAREMAISSVESLRRYLFYKEMDSLEAHALNQLAGQLNITEVKIASMSGQFRCGSKINLPILCAFGPNCVLARSKRASLLLNLRSPSCSAQVNASGFVSILGARCHADMYLAARRICHIIKQTGSSENPQVIDFVINNVVLSCKLPYNFDLSFMELRFQQAGFDASFPKGTFPCVKLKGKYPAPNDIKLFQSGSFTIMGLRNVADCILALDYYNVLLSKLVEERANLTSEQIYGNQYLHLDSSSINWDALRQAGANIGGVPSSSRGGGTTKKKNKMISFGGGDDDDDDDDGDYTGNKTGGSSSSSSSSRQQRQTRRSATNRDFQEYDMGSANDDDSEDSDSGRGKKRRGSSSRKSSTIRKRAGRSTTTTTTGAKRTGGAGTAGRKRKLGSRDNEYDDEAVDSSDDDDDDNYDTNRAGRTTKRNSALSDDDDDGFESGSTEYTDSDENDDDEYIERQLADSDDNDEPQNEMEAYDIEFASDHE